MKQIRKISNLVAEELQEVLNANGVTMEDAAFEGRVSEIVDMISEAVDESGCGKKKRCQSSEGCGSDEMLDEEVDVDEVYMATEDITVGGVQVYAGEYVEIDEIDLENDTITVTIYDVDGEVKEEEIDVPVDDIKEFEDSAEMVEVDENGELCEAVHIKNGKKVKVSAAVEKLRAKLKAKKGSGVNKFTIKNGKIVKKSAEQLKADKKKSKVFAKQMKKFAKKRAKSLKKFNKLNSGAGSGSVVVKEGFDITSDGMVFAVESGDIITLEEGKITVIREGATLIKGLAVSESFIETCISEGVCEPKDCKDDEEDKVDEAALLTFKSDKGFVLVKEGAEIPMGNRIRTRAFLKNEGFNVTSVMLDKASEGEVVTL